VKDIQKFDRTRKEITVTGGTRRSWKDNIEKDLTAVECVVVDWINLLKPSGNFTYHQVQH
jgi:hypothetical protein